MFYTYICFRFSFPISKAEIFMQSQILMSSCLFVFIKWISILTLFVCGIYCSCIINKWYSPTCWHTPSLLYHRVFLLTTFVEFSLCHLFYFLVNIKYICRLHLLPSSHLMSCKWMSLFDLKLAVNLRPVNSSFTVFCRFFWWVRRLTHKFSTSFGSFIDILGADMSLN